MIINLKMNGFCVNSDTVEQVCTLSIRRNCAMGNTLNGHRLM